MVESRCCCLLPDILVWKYKKTLKFLLISELSEVVLYWKVVHHTFKHSWKWKSISQFINSIWLEQ